MVLQFLGGMMIRMLMGLVFVSVLFGAPARATGKDAGTILKVKLGETSEAFQNPMKGFRPTRALKDWDASADLAVSVTLAAGENTIRFYNDAGWAADFDKLAVAGKAYEADTRA